MWELETRILLNFLTFLLIIIQFVSCISFSGFSLFMKVMPTVRFHWKTTYAMTQQPITPRTYQRHINDVSPNKVLSNIIPSHAYNNIFNNTPSNGSYQTTYRTTYHTTYHTSYVRHTKHQTTINQRAYPTTYQQTFQTYQTNDKPNSLQIIQQSTTWGYEE